MPLGLAFWIICLIWLLFGFYRDRELIAGGNYGVAGSNLLLFMLLLLLGWGVFGAPIKG